MKTLSLLKITGLSLLCVWLVPHWACADPARVLKRADKPEFVEVKDNDKAMAQAVQKARATLKKFMAALRAPKANQSRFAIKKPFFEGDKVEHLWLTDVRFDGRHFYGKIDNEPADITGVHMGQEVTLSPAEVSDWMYVQDDHLVGGYTIRCLCRELPPDERKQFEEELDYRVD